MEFLFDTRKFTRYKKEMDIQNALKLLDLEPDATLEDARAAFKKKAKQFHPDKLMAATKTGDDGEKMKDINVAYLTLKTVLKPGTRKKETRLLPEFFSPACRRLVDRVGQWMTDTRLRFRPFISPARPGTAPPRNPGCNQSCNPGCNPPGNSPGTPPRKPTRPSMPPEQPANAFEDVLRQSMRRRMAREKRYTAYARYLELEKRMKRAREQRPAGADWEVDSVEPVSRIKPVK